MSDDALAKKHLELEHLRVEEAALRDAMTPEQAAGKIVAVVNAAPDPFVDGGNEWVHAPGGGCTCAVM
ncbi:G protein gamma domain-containing protein [Plasmodiophora brassicae]